MLRAGPIGAQSCRVYLAGHPTLARTSSRTQFGGQTIEDRLVDLARESERTLRFR